SLGRLLPRRRAGALAVDACRRGVPAPGRCIGWSGSGEPSLPASPAGLLHLGHRALFARSGLGGRAVRRLGLRALAIVAGLGFAVESAPPRLPEMGIENFGVPVWGTPGC